MPGDVPCPGTAVFGVGVYVHRLHVALVGQNHEPGRAVVGTQRSDGVGPVVVALLPLLQEREPLDDPAVDAVVPLLQDGEHVPRVEDQPVGPFRAIRIVRVVVEVGPGGQTVILVAAEAPYVGRFDEELQRGPVLDDQRAYPHDGIELAHPALPAVGRPAYPQMAPGYLQDIGALDRPYRGRPVLLVAVDPYGPVACHLGVVPVAEDRPVDAHPPVLVAHHEPRAVVEGAPYLYQGGAHQQRLRERAVGQRDVGPAVDVVQAQPLVEDPSDGDWDCLRSRERRRPYADLRRHPGTSLKAASEHAPVDGPIGDVDPAREQRVRVRPVVPNPAPAVDRPVHDGPSDDHVPVGGHGVVGCRPRDISEAAPMDVR